MLYFYIQTLQNKYSSTYRKIPYNETREHLKQRHREYANLGRLIQESCWIYGEPINKESKLSFYHGINCQLLFPKCVATFIGPTSTSTTKAVAVNFCSGNGIFLSSFLCKEIEQELIPNVHTIKLKLKYQKELIKLNGKY